MHVIAEHKIIEIIDFSMVTIAAKIVSHPGYALQRGTSGAASDRTSHHTMIVMVFPTSDGKRSAEEAARHPHKRVM